MIERREATVQLVEHQVLEARVAGMGALAGAIGGLMIGLWVGYGARSRTA